MDLLRGGRIFPANPGNRSQECSHSLRPFLITEPENRALSRHCNARRGKARQIANKS
jgi:hypothetical protein